MAEINQEVWTIRSVLGTAEAFLKKQGVDSARLDAELLLADVLGWQRLQLYLNLDQPLNMPEREAFKVFLRRRAAHEPAAYILGWKGFWTHTFKVNPAVLIPRPETEFLVESCLEIAKALSSNQVSLRILDIATGSGCIALSIASELPDAHVIGGDISDAALSLAAENQRQLGKGQVQFLNFDLFKADSYESVEPVDIVVSNPPYITLSDWQSLATDVREFEPRLALVAGEDGLDCYRAISEHIHKILKPGGWLMLELGIGQSDEVRRLFEGSGLVFEKLVFDYNRIARVLVLRKQLD